MQYTDWLKHAQEQLNGIATARLDCLVLLEDALQKDRSYILAHSEEKIDGAIVKKLSTQIERRAKHEPLAYIRGKSEFYGREFMVSPDTLEPRPETETMIELLKSHFPSLLKDGPFTDEKNVKLRIIDVGTGSGCLAITAKLEIPEAQVYATEINQDALKIAKTNAKKLDASVQFFNGNLLQSLPSNVYDQLSILLCNLPYVPDGHTINKAAMYEPRVAIFGGEDGLDLYRELFTQLASRKSKVENPKLIFTESLPPQHKALSLIAKNGGYDLKQTDDFIQVFKKG